MKLATDCHSKPNSKARVRNVSTTGSHRARLCVDQAVCSRTVRDVLDRTSNRRPTIQRTHPIAHPTESALATRLSGTRAAPLLQDAIGLGLCDPNEDAGRRYRRLDEESTLYQGLPFSCPFSASTGCNPLQGRAKAKRRNSLRSREKLEYIRGAATTCKGLQNGLSQGSGPGGRWFESTRPDQSLQ